MQYWHDMCIREQLFIITLTLSQVLVYLSISCGDALFISLLAMFFFLAINLLNEKLFYHLWIVFLPFTYIVTVYLYNTDLFKNNFKIIASIKLISFVLLPVIISSARHFKKMKMRTIDILFIVFITISCMYYFKIGDSDGNRLTNIVQITPFIIFMFMGRLMCLGRINLIRLENTYLKTCIFIIIIGIPMYFAIDYLPDFSLSPKKYSIESIGMQERQFVGEYAASTYSALLGSGRYEHVVRFFSIFFSGIGLAYFLSIGFIIALYRKYTWHLIIIGISIIATLTRATWILLLLSPILVLYYSTKSKIKKAVLLSTMISSIIAFIFYFMHIFIGFFIENKQSAFDFIGTDQSAAEHIRSIIVFYDLIKNNLFGYGMNYNSGESFLVDVFARTGILGFIVFLTIFVLIINKFKNHYLLLRHDEVKIALCLLIFNIIGSLFSRENFTIIDSYMSWIYIGYVLEKVSLKRELVEGQVTYTQNIMELRNCAIKNIN